MEKVLVKVDWIHPSQGGRKQLPQGDSFIAVTRFPHQSYEQWIANAWSIRLDWLDTENQGSWYGLAYFAVQDSPSNWLVPGGHFDIYEGPKMIGQISVMSTAKAIENIIKVAA